MARRWMSELLAIRQSAVALFPWVLVPSRQQNAEQCYQFGAETTAKRQIKLQLNISSIGIFWRSLNKTGAVVTNIFQSSAWPNYPRGSVYLCNLFTPGVRPTKKYRGCVCGTEAASAVRTRSRLQTFNHQKTHCTRAHELASTMACGRPLVLIVLLLLAPDGLFVLGDLHNMGMRWVSDAFEKLSLRSALLAHVDSKSATMQPQ